MSKEFSEEKLKWLRIVPHSECLGTPNKQTKNKNRKQLTTNAEEIAGKGNPYPPLKGLQTKEASQETIYVLLTSS